MMKAMVIVIILITIWIEMTMVVMVIIAMLTKDVIIPNILSIISEKAVIQQSSGS